MIADAIGRIPMSSNLAASLSRASGYAEAQLHREVALEHLLLALTEDPDAAQILAASNIDVGRVVSDVSGYLGRLEDRNRPEDASRLNASGDLKRILEAAAAASRGRRREINGAIVLAAIVGDARTTAAHILQAQGLTFEEAIRVLQRTMLAPAQQQAAPPPVPMPSRPAPPPLSHSDTSPPPLPSASMPPTASAGTEDLLAQARARVHQARIPVEEQPEYPTPPAPSAYSDAGYAEADATAAPPPVSAQYHAMPPEPEVAATEIAAPWDAAEVAATASTYHDSPELPPLPVERPAAIHADVAPDAVAPAVVEPIGDDAATYATTADGEMVPAPWPEAPAEELPAAPHGQPHQHVHHDHHAHPAFAPAAAAGWSDATASGASQQPPAHWPDAPVANPAMPPPLPMPDHRPPRPAPRVPGAAFPNQPPSFREPELPPHPVYPRWPEPAFERAGQPELPPSVPPTMLEPLAPPAYHQTDSAPNQAPAPMYAPRAAVAVPPGVGAPWPAQSPARSNDELANPQARAPDPREEPSFSTAEAQARSTLDVEPGKLVENIPRTMRVGVASVVEVRIAKAAVKALADNMAGVGQPYQHQVLITKAMSVRLRAPDGGFYIEMASPETQWIENTLGLMSDDFASWRWSVTPRRRGKIRLQLAVAARTVGRDGSTAETALPDQVIEVRVATNYGQSMRRWAGWVLAAIIGGALSKFGESILAGLNKFFGLLAAG